MSHKCVGTRQCLVLSWYHAWIRNTQHLCTFIYNAFASFAPIDNPLDDKLCRTIIMSSLLFALFATVECDRCDFKRTTLCVSISIDLKGFLVHCERCDHKSSTYGFNKMNCLLCAFGLYCLIQYSSSKASSFSLKTLAVLKRLLVDSNTSLYVV